jgi:copper chaperone CopZ
VTGVLQALPGVTEVVVSLEAGEARVSHEPAQVSVAALRRAIEDAGFDAE